MLSYVFYVLLDNSVRGIKETETNYLPGLVLLNREILILLNEF